MSETLEIIFFVINSILLIAIVFLLLNRKPVGNNRDDGLETRMSGNFSNLMSAFSNSMVDFSNKVNETLNNSTKQSNNDVNELRIKMNQELSEFKSNFEKRLNEGFISISDTLEKRMLSINEKVDGKLNEGFEKTTKTFSEIVIAMNKIETAKASIDSLTTEVNDLHNVLSNNQSRGAFGEFQLNQILANVFGDRGNLYDLQYTINETDVESKRVRTDAVVFMKQPDCILCIDSKFPYSSYSQIYETVNITTEQEKKLISSFAQEVKKHVNDISSKYILEHITADYALMFVPSDGVLSLLHARCHDIVEYAIKSKVVIVSPTTLIPTLFSYRVMINDAIRNEKSREIKIILDKLAVDFKSFSERWTKINNSMNSLIKQSGDLDISVRKIDTKFNRIKNMELEESEKEDLIEIGE